ncbi:MAG TPA: hypothetical protein PKI14_01375 [Fervidobacterium sp.]|nr:hypothetical protein [Fervidobacterium sp.]
MKILTADEMRKKKEEEKAKEEASKFESAVETIYWHIERYGSFETGPFERSREVKEYTDSNGLIQHSFSPTPYGQESKYCREDLLNKFRDFGYKVEITPKEYTTKYSARYIDVEDKFMWIFTTTKKEVVWDPIETKTFHTIKISL